MIRSAIVWSGASRLDGETPITLLLTGLQRSGSANRKTGAMVKAHVLVDGAVPAEAADDGRSAAICGDCPRRKTATRGARCYVSLARAYPNIGRLLVAGEYPRLTVDEASALVTGRGLRVTEYGDPAAVPVEIWMPLVGRAGYWTAYTHQWRRAPELRPIAMASVESAGEATEAKALGWRTYRVRAVVGDPVGTHETVCPASVEAGKRTTCAKCRLCSGLASPGRDIAIIDHSVAGLWARDLGPRKRKLPLAQTQAMREMLAGTAQRGRR